MISPEAEMGPNLYTTKIIVAGVGPSQPAVFSTFSTQKHPHFHPMGLI
ncbi:hypothetical protein [Geoalkalibacter halelectricus]|nr:hypothetical protein [Geoalkalibacter halelectricus]